MRTYKNHRAALELATVVLDLARDVSSEHTSCELAFTRLGVNECTYILRVVPVACEVAVRATLRHAGFSVPQHNASSPTPGLVNALAACEVQQPQPVGRPPLTPSTEHCNYCRDDSPAQCPRHGAQHAAMRIRS